MKVLIVVCCCCLSLAAYADAAAKFKLPYAITVEKEAEDLKNVLRSLNLEVNLLLIAFYCIAYEILTKVYL